MMTRRRRMMIIIIMIIATTIIIKHLERLKARRLLWMWLNA